MIILYSISALLKSCFFKLWNGVWYLSTCISSIRNVFKKQRQYSHDTSQQEASRPAARQRSDSLPEGISEIRIGLKHNACVKHRKWGGNCACFLDF